jgi:diguanylate cyclase (GGDEF)-like protein
VAVRILIAEDERMSRVQLQGLLQRWGYTVDTVPDGTEALGILQSKDPPDLAVLDWMMPGLDGIDVCRAIRQCKSEPYIYVILLTGQNSKTDMLAGFEAGADDYITKPFEAQELKARVQTGARIAELQQQLITTREQLRFQGLRDSLTHALNRLAFFDLYDREITRVCRNQSSLALIIGDVDHFKRINDQYGHVAGDAVLRETARRLRVTQRACDAVARYGGEEFVVLAPDCDEAGGRALAERFRMAISTEPMPVVHGTLMVTMSFGVAATSNMDNAEKLLQIADERLYRAKDLGRNRVV